MTTVYIIGSNRFNKLKKELYNSFNKEKDVVALAVGFSNNFNEALTNKDYNLLHSLEDKAIEDADIIILVDNDEIYGKPYVGNDTLREVRYCKKLNKKIITSDMLFDIYLKKKV